MKLPDGKIKEDKRPYFIELSFREYLASRPDFSIVRGIEDSLEKMWQSRKFLKRVKNMKKNKESNKEFENMLS